MEKLKNFFFISSLLLLLGGCSSLDNKFQDKETAKQYITSKLENKYHEEFVYKKSETEYFKKYPTKRIYMGTFSPKENTSRVVEVWASNSGEIKDNYASYFYQDTIDQRTKDLLKDKHFITSSVIEFVGGKTTKNFTDSTEFEEYFQETESFYEVEIELRKNLSDEEYASEIESILHSLYEPLNHFYLKVKQDNKLIFMYEFNKEKKSLSKTEILEDLKNQKEEREYMEEVFSSMSESE